MQRFFLCIMAMAIAIPTFAQIIMGKVLEPNNQPAINARVTLFQDSGATFLEVRTNTNGDYRFENLDVAKYRIGVAKPGFQYLEKELAMIGSTLVFNIQLEVLTEKGRWDIIMDSPEPLGGTDLGVLMPNGNIYYCHNTKDPFFFLPKQNDTASAVGSIQVQGCVGPALLSTGKVLFLGGTLQEVYGRAPKG
ncbi:MAG: carboxypeptidase regulatory-like domain-containing protein [Haliscomenobacter sp.]|nr:carboxypeptidase-like regulatory domain-containing protein [Haliscomenobacter sp.]MBK9488844.1 carboxypeptidase regulatory-like domain-containing protein [Haliscomenobacter sp.]